MGLTHHQDETGQPRLDTHRLAQPLRGHVAIDHRAMALAAGQGDNDVVVGRRQLGRVAHHQEAAVGRSRGHGLPHGLPDRGDLLIGVRLRPGQQEDEQGRVFCGQLPAEAGHLRPVVIPLGGRGLVAPFGLAVGQDDNHLAAGFRGQRATRQLQRAELVGPTQAGRVAQALEQRGAGAGVRQAHRRGHLPGLAAEEDEAARGAETAVVHTQGLDEEPGRGQAQQLRVGADAAFVEHAVAVVDDKLDHQLFARRRGLRPNTAEQREEQRRQQRHQQRHEPQTAQRPAAATTPPPPPALLHGAADFRQRCQEPFHRP